ncbi:hypothetical protein [Spirosoma panaciterrae]|uniref:hypothetical protein n=1 Tax=Spirosoma panaciterrae TaxID=496058 RepID=UPI00036BFA59|nr:hypothetical protein [Spirosoma panaciterrae]
MTHTLATLVVALLLTGTAVAQQKPGKRSTGAKTPTTTSTSTDAASASNKKEQGTVAGTGLTNDQYQTQATDNSTDKPTKVDAASSVRTGPSSVKARKKSPKSGN